MKDTIKNTYTLVPLHIFGVYSIIKIFEGTAPSWWWLTCIIGYVMFKMLGIGAGYHRLICHKSFKVNRLMKIFILWCGVVSGQGSPIFWCAVHRGYHHRYSDTIKDLHSPKHGFWHSYILWIFKLNYKTLQIRSVIDLVKDKEVSFFHNNYNKIIIISHLVIAMISVNLWLYLMILPCLISLHSFLSQTSLTHISFMGYRNYDTKDTSVNSIWLFPFILGEAWHNNHHGEGRNPNFGGRNWWELDPTYWLIKLIESKHV